VLDAGVDVTGATEEAVVESEVTEDEVPVDDRLWASTSVNWFKRMARERSVRMRAALAEHRMVASGEGRGNVGDDGRGECR